MEDMVIDVVRRLARLVVLIFSTPIPENKVTKSNVRNALLVSLIVSPLLSSFANGGVVFSPSELLTYFETAAFFISIPLVFVVATPLSRSWAHGPKTELWSALLAAILLGLVWCALVASVGVLIGSGIAGEDVGVEPLIALWRFATMVYFIAVGLPMSAIGAIVFWLFLFISNPKVK